MYTVHTCSCMLIIYLNHGTQSANQYTRSNTQHDTHRKYNRPEVAMNINSSAQYGGRSGYGETTS